jgi:hypothetical protein
MNERNERTMLKMKMRTYNINSYNQASASRVMIKKRMVRYVETTKHGGKALRATKQQKPRNKASGPYGRGTQLGNQANTVFNSVGTVMR